MGQGQFGSLLGLNSSQNFEGADSSPLGASNIIRSGTTNYHWGVSKDGESDEIKYPNLIKENLDEFYSFIDELRSYKDNELTKIILDIIKESVAELFVGEDEDFITIPSSEVEKYGITEDQIRELNKILRDDINLVSNLRSDLHNFIYYGSVSYYLSKEEEKYVNSKGEEKIRKVFRFKYPHESNSLITEVSNGEVKDFILREVGLVSNNSAVDKDHLVVFSTLDYNVNTDSGDGGISTFDFDTINLSTVSTIEKDENGDGEVSEEEKIFKSSRYLAGTPLYDSITVKLKEFVLKDYLISILGIKDLIQPLILLLGVEKTTDATDASELAIKVEDIINQNVDLNYLASGQLRVDEITKSLIDNIRVIPDFDSKLSSLSNLELDRLSDKISDLRSDQNDIKESIIGATGVPIGLFNGETTRFEAIASSQRFNSKLNYYVDILNNSSIRLAKTLYKLKFGKDITKVKLESRLVNKTILNTSYYSDKIEATNNRIEQINNLVETFDRMRESELLKKDELIKYFKGVVGKVDPELSDLIADQIEENEDGDEFGGGGRSNKRRR